MELNRRRLIAVSALTGVGMDELLNVLDTRLSDLFMVTLTINLPASEGEKLAWIYRHGNVLTQDEEEGILIIAAKLTKENAARWKKMQNNF